MRRRDADRYDGGGDHNRPGRPEVHAGDGRAKPVDPFSTVTVGDLNVGAGSDTLTITLSDDANGALSGAGLSGGTNGVYSASALVGVACVPLIVGATAASVSVTVVVSSVVGVPKALLLSLSAKVVVVALFGVPAAGVNVSASSSVVIAAAVPVRV